MYGIAVLGIHRVTAVMAFCAIGAEMAKHAMGVDLCFVIAVIVSAMMSKRMMTKM